jgi:plastocyanin
MKKAILTAGTAVLVALALGLSISGQAKPAANAEPNGQFQVNIDNFSFTPATLTVPVGAKVTWTNKDDVPHTVVSTNNAFTRSPALDTDDSFSYTFTKPGTYEYYCSVHPMMTGKIVAQ